MKRAHRYLYYIESAWYLSWARLNKFFLQQTHKHLRQGYFQCETLRTPLSHSTQQIQAISQAIKLMAMRLPWTVKCLDQAIAAECMLSRRKLPSTLYLGMSKNTQEKWTAHAWIRAGQDWVVGYNPCQSYTVVGTYARIFT
jgi:hypothetical protein